MIHPICTGIRCLRQCTASSPFGRSNVATNRSWSTVSAASAPAHPAAVVHKPRFCGTETATRESENTVQTGSVGLGLVPFAVFFLALVTTWSIRESLNETFWFAAGWVGGLLVLYMAEVAGYGIFSTSATGIGGGVALLVGFVSLMYRRRQWRKEQAIKKAREEAERVRRRARGQTEPSVLSGVFRAIHKARSSNRQ